MFRPIHGSSSGILYFHVYYTQIDSQDIRGDALIGAHCFPITDIVVYHQELNVFAKSVLHNEA